MKMTCISHPANERLVIIRKWQVDFCEGNQCAAALLSFFEYWHSWKLNADAYNRKSNDIAEFHGETRSLPEHVLQYHTLAEMSDGILGLYGQKKISEAIKLLVFKSAISIHVNPNPKFHHDKTQYFKFYPEVCNNWINNSYKSGHSKSATCMTQNSNFDMTEMHNACDENASRDVENAVYRTEINNKEIIKQNVTSVDALFDDQQHVVSEEAADSINSLIAMLIKKGMPSERLINHKDLPDLVQLLYRGATASMIIEAYDRSVKSTSANGKTFGLRYLITAVNRSLEKFTHLKTATAAIDPESKYKNDYRRGTSWMGDLIS